MSEHPAAPVLRELVADLAPEQRTVLAHLCECAACRRTALRPLAFARRRPARTSSTGNGGAFDLEGPAHARHRHLGAGLLVRSASGSLERARQSEAAPALLAEVEALPREEAARAVQRARFANLPFAALLLERARAEADVDPRGAGDRARLALGIARRLAAAHPDPETLSLASRAATTAASARRLAGEPRQAEEDFRTASRCLSGPPEGLERADYARAHALLDWERGELERATALLAHARRIFAAAGAEAEEAATLAVLGLLWVERTEPERALALLRRAARRAREVPLSPPLRARLHIQRAALHAALDETEEAQAALALGRQTLDAVTEKGQKTILRGLLGRALARLGDRAAVDLLDEVRREALALGRLPEALLATHHAHALRLANEAGEEEPSAAADRAATAALAELESAFPAHPAVEAASCLLGAMSLRIAGGRLQRRVEDLLAAQIRQVCRHEGLRVEPLPFL